jgi:hypothetical protein
MREPPQKTGIVLPEFNDAGTFSLMLHGQTEMFAEEVDPFFD